MVRAADKNKASSVDMKMVADNSRELVDKRESSLVGTSSVDHIKETSKVNEQ